MGYDSTHFIWKHCSFAIFDPVYYKTLNGFYMCELISIFTFIKDVFDWLIEKKLIKSNSLIDLLCF